MLWYRAGPVLFVSEVECSVGMMDLAWVLNFHINVDNVCLMEDFNY